MTIGSVFSGVGGIELGLQSVGFGPVLWQVEIDSYCRSVLARHWPKAERFDDVRGVGGKLCPVDVLVGGPPCVDLSVAGLGVGVEGERSGLWREFVGIIRELEPRWVIMENVTALLARGLGSILRELAQIGYDAQWDCLPAQACGAPHRRDRLFMVAWPVSHPISQPIRYKPKRGSETPQPPICGHAQPLDVGSVMRHRWPPASTNMHAWGQLQPDFGPALCRESNGLSSRVDAARVSALGNAVVPQVAAVVGRAVLDAERQRAGSMLGLGGDHGQ